MRGSWPHIGRSLPIHWRDLDTISAQRRNVSATLMLNMPLAKGQFVGSALMFWSQIDLMI